MSDDGRVTIRILRHMARSGGTLISKCIGCMDGVVLLSEIHPANLGETRVIEQARDWFGLITKGEARRWRFRGFPGTPEFVTLCERRAREQGKTLVLRDWSHLDYIGMPFATPTLGSQLRACLLDRFRVIETCSARDAIDQWRSLTKLTVIRDLQPSVYLAGCVAFARYAEHAGFVRYEDFTHDPDGVLETLCDRLELPFDPQYQGRWTDYTTITGDTEVGVGRGAGSRSIQPLDRRTPEPELATLFAGQRDYLEYCQRLGYTPVAVPAGSTGS